MSISPHLILGYALKFKKSLIYKEAINLYHYNLFIQQIIPNTQNTNKSTRFQLFKQLSNQEIVLPIPDSNEIFGVHASLDFAFAIESTFAGTSKFLAW